MKKYTEVPYAEKVDFVLNYLKQIGVEYTLISVTDSVTKIPLAGFCFLNTKWLVKPNKKIILIPWTKEDANDTVSKMDVEDGNGEGITV